MILKKSNKNTLEPAGDKWIEIAFPVVTASIVSVIIIPGLFLQLTEKFHINLSGLFRIAFSMISAQALLIIPLLAVALLTSGNAGLRDKLGLINWKKSYLTEACYCELLLIFPLWIIAAAMFFLVSYFGFDTTSPIISLLNSASKSGKFLIFTISVFVAPIVEEIVFRRVIFTFINRLFGVIPGLLITSFVFSILHGGIVQIVPLMILGIVLQVLYLKHKSLYPSVLLHLIHNFLIMSIFLTLEV